ncbi:chloride channel protein [Cryobacterium cheniae]|uniref:chloride channel protein n=1 Tax=Cryobacterium cheniae TaxID=1259262 RepID=UPI0030BA1D0E
MGGTFVNFAPVACGAAGAIAATVNAPIAAVFFALELLLRDFAARSFGILVLSSVTASIVGRSILGDACAGGHDRGTRRGELPAHSG